MKKNLWTIIIFLFFGFVSFFYVGCNKTDYPFGIYATHGLDVPSPTFTPATGTFNCYVYDGSPKQGVTIELVDPAGNTIGANTTDEYGNASFSPSPLYLGSYEAVLPAQGRYGFSSLPITVVSTSQGPVSAQFWAGNQALTIASGAPASFSSGTGQSIFTLNYFEPGTLNVPVTVTANSLSSPFTSSPATFVLDMAVTSQAVTVAKVSCAALNQPVTWYGTDFKGLSFLSAPTTLFRNFPISVQLSVSRTCTSCGSNNTNTCTDTFSLSSIGDCGIVWTLSGYNHTASISSGGSVKWYSGILHPCNSEPTFPVTLSSPIGIAIGSGNSGTIINASF